MKGGGGGRLKEGTGIGGMEGGMGARRGGGLARGAPETDTTNDNAPFREACPWRGSSP